MNVDFNNVRRQAVMSYNGLCKKLNHCISEDGFSGGKVIEINVDEIQGLMDGLRGEIATIALCYQKDDPDIKCVLGDDETLETFNPEG